MSKADDAAVRLCERYELHATIARGGMAAVRLGRIRGVAGFARVVAIKELHAHLANDPEFVAMLLDEARLVSRIRHPNVVAVQDLVASDDGVLLVMEYIHGVSLARLLRAGRDTEAPLAPPVAVAIVVDALAGLEAAHRATSEDGEPLGIIHRDVSPSNLIVGEDGVTRVLDFGIAKAAARSQTTREGALKGKLSYMAPELLRGSVATPRADIYAAGIVLWEALACRPLFRANSEAELLGRVLEGVVPPPSRFRQVLPGELDAVVSRALCRQPEDRYASAEEMAAALAAALAPAAKFGVSEEVARLGSAALRKRRRQVERVERGPGVVDEETTQAADPAFAGTRTAVPRSHDDVSADDGPTIPDTEDGAPADSAHAVESVGPSRPNRWARSWAWLGATAAVLLGAGMAFATRDSAAPLRLRDAGLARAASIALDVAREADVDPDAPAAARTNGHESLAASPPSIESTLPDAHRNAGPHRPPPRRTSQPASAPNCNPPVERDARGILRVKPGCARPNDTP